MSARRLRRSALTVPIALTTTVVAASFALYYFFSENGSQDTENTTHVHESDAELTRRPSTRRRSGSTGAAAAGGGVSGGGGVFAVAPRKKAIALVVHESTVPSAMMEQLPSPLPLHLADVFVLIYSPSMTSHPLNASDAAAFENSADEGTVYAQAHKMFHKDAPTELVMPYADEKSLVPMLKQLAPEHVYIEDSLVGQDAAVVTEVLGGRWVGGVVVSVEEPAEGQRIADATGRLGRGVKVLDVARVGDDWKERVG